MSKQNVAGGPRTEAKRKDAADQHLFNDVRNGDHGSTYPKAPGQKDIGIQNCNSVQNIPDIVKELDDVFWAISNLPGILVRCPWDPSQNSYLNDDDGPDRKLRILDSENDLGTHKWKMEEAALSPFPISLNGPLLCDGLCAPRAPGIPFAH